MLLAIRDLIAIKVKVTAQDNRVCCVIGIQLRTGLRVMKDARALDVARLLEMAPKLNARVLANCQWHQDHTRCFVAKAFFLPHEILSCASHIATTRENVNRLED